MGSKDLPKCPFQCLRCLRDKEDSCPLEVRARPDFVTWCKFYQPSSDGLS